TAGADRGYGFQQQVFGVAMMSGKPRMHPVGEHGSKSGVGASIMRNEDERFLNGRGLFVSDVTLPGMLHAAFLRSPHAHARIKSIRKPPHAADKVFVGADLIGVKPIRSSPNFSTFKHSDFPVL